MKRQRINRADGLSGTGVVLLTSGERGQILVIVALLLPILMGAVALGADVAVFYYNWAELQRAADASVLAGAAYLPANTSRASETAVEYAEMNGAEASEIATPVISQNNLRISVTLTRTVPYYFAHVLGLTSNPVSAGASAALQIAGAASGPLPVGLDIQTVYSYGQTIVMHETGTEGPGNWGGLALGCTGSNCFRNNLANGYQGTLTVGQAIQSEPGATTGPTSQGIGDRVANGLALDPGGSWNNFTLNDPRAAIVPVVDWTGCGGSCTVVIKGFAAVWINSASGSDISATFIGMITPGSTPNQSAANYGAYKPVLSQ